MDNKKKGGLLLKYAGKTEEIFNDFLHNAIKIEYIADGANGIIYKIVVPENYESGYTYIDPNYYGEPVREIALKICILKPSDMDSFKNEVNIQTDIFKKSLDYLQPLCPAILFSKILRDEEKHNLITRMLKIDSSIGTHKLPYLDSEIDIDGELLTNKKYLIGIIGMEYENGYLRLYDFIRLKTITKETKIKYINYGLFILLKLALETGYSQADFHTANIMIHPTMDYFGKNTGRPLILDFGYSRKINENTMRKIRDSVSKHDYITALKRICGVKRSDNSSITKESWSSYYGWVCRDWDLLTNTSISKSVGKSMIKVGDDMEYSVPKNIVHSNKAKLSNLFKLREKYREQLLVKFNKLNEESPINYPKLPLSPDIIKERTYIGLVGGRTIRIKKKNKPKNKTSKII